MKKQDKKSAILQRNIEALAAENRKLRIENREINERFQIICQKHFNQMGYVNWLEKQNKRLLDCMNHGAIAMMNYQESFQN